ncbi:RagB/SusD family nutrient uptake outer membrane protein [Aestuariivivens sediminis]|uniref:RagB/SusD family nutrient uptake outer membrane protein n=1 Tax=Aestuariivivens sediminis TaxID=2913557 RepID=UPI001F55BC47|nr:RagB/SusD family nutrient uptake outer membrane protein [Aestuariivivens sediminis]
MKKQLTKSIRKIVYLSVLIVSFISCDDLPVDTKGELAAEQFYSSVADIESGTLGVYSVLLDKLFANSENYCHFWAADDRTAVTGSNKTFYLEFDQMVPLATNAWQTNGWNQLWEIIGAANTFLDNEEQMRSFVEGEDLELLERSLGEVHYLRGLIYFELVRTWGTVPLITSQADITGQEPLATFDAIYALIIDDLKYAKNNLGPTSVNGTYRANKWWAQSLLANVYLTSAGFPLKKTENYALAAAEAKQVIDNGPYDLEEEYGGIMGKRENNLSENGNTEAIIAFPAFVPLDGWSAGNYQAEAILFGDKVVEKTFYAEFPEGVRKDFTFDNVGGVIQYSKEKFGEQDFGSVNKDINYLRYPELLLIYAEAQIRATGNNSDSSALTALNAVRERADLLPLTSATWEDVVWEKAWELAGEWTRWYDIIRTETLDEVNAIRSSEEPAQLSSSPTLTESFPWSPIPANDVNINPNLAK